jgi:hypothetical protein
MGWRPKGDTPTKLPRRSPKGAMNRQCVTCTPPCQGGEVLHRRGYCCHSYCACVAFTPAGSSLIAALDPHKSSSTRRKQVLE